ncbi:hypothetical protein FG385_18345 [Amycolatopsis alkalitolerans]|uniref:Uncharacterized protein n=1 Tax=Amycolatopsis alkalitolerans TaxID=2547244 RepID=A0A5C4LZT9_9PSEU|nr:hypothetical protein [Amycolatopsis alkalitolerans]TNC24383.1 hypothetical protein FG385_18345 [Amycolatopsis alkalitolerans]
MPVGREAELTVAHHYSPDRAAFRDFAQFREFVTGPLHAGALTVDLRGGKGVSLWSTTLRPERR